MPAQNTNTQIQTVWNEQTLQTQCLSHSLPLNIFQHYKESSDQPGEGQGPHGNGKWDVEGCNEGQDCQTDSPAKHEADQF